MKDLKNIIDSSLRFTPLRMTKETKIFLGVDYGAKRIGLAIGDSETKVAVVFGTVEKIEDIAEIVKSEDVDDVVIGKPYSVVNQEHELPDNFKKFVAELKDKLPDMEIIFEDERLSSKYADSLVGNKKTKASRDEIAAVSILQGYLDRAVICERSPAPREGLDEAKQSREY